VPELDARRTVSDETAVRRAFERAWQTRFGEPVDPHVLRLLLAHSDLETGAWKSMFHHNLGNIVVTSESSPYFRLKENGVKTAHRYRIYDDLDDGADGMIRQLTSNTRPQWHEGLLTGNPFFFVDSLAGKHGGPAYFEANVERYLNGFLNRWDRYPVEGSAVTTKRSANVTIGAIAALSLLWWAVSKLPTNKV